MDIVEIINQINITKGIYGYSYMDNEHSHKAEIIFIPIKDLQCVHAQHSCDYAFFYKWGQLDSDWTFYNFNDYNKTWSFNKEELK